MDAPTPPLAIGTDELAASLPPGPRRDYAQAQHEVLAHHGTRAHSVRVDLADPPLGAHVLLAGTGDPVVVVHGGNGTAVMMEPLLGSLASEHAVFAPDRPGCGLSDRFDYAGVDIRRHAVRWLTSLFDALGLQRAALVANSMGGYWSLCFALEHPERVSRLALVGEPAGSAEKVAFPFRVLAMPGFNRLLFATRLKPSPGSVRATYSGRLVHDVGRVGDVHLQAALAGARIPGAQLAWRTIVERAAAPWIRRSPLTHALRPELPGLRVPTLFVWGADDRLGPPSLGEQMAEMIPDGHVVTVADAGHLVWLDQPELVSKTVLDFLR